MSTVRRENIIGLAGTIAFHAILLILFLFYYISSDKEERSDPELGGVPVMFGNVRDALGDDEPFGRGNGLTENVTEVIESDPTMPNNLDNTDATETVEVEPKQPAKPVIKSQPKTDTKAVATQDTERTIAIQEQKKKEAEQKKKDAAEAESKRKEKDAADRKAQQEAESKKNINSQMAGLFGNGSGNGSRGNTYGSGTQGSPSGNGSVGKVSGVGGTGSYDLGGRGTGSGGLKLPSYTVDDYGTVVVDIIVDPKGNVIEASIGKGTNTTNSTLRNESRKAALKTKFAVVNGTNNQKGTITYKFNLN